VRKFSEKRVTLMLIALLLGILVSLGGAAAEKTTLIIAITADPRGLSPVFAATFHDWVVGYRLYSSLIQADENFQPVPDLAKSWEVSPDGLTYTFHLKRDATFHDGTLITSEDVKFSIEEILLKHASICIRGLGKVIESIETPDEHTIVFHLKKPYPEMLNPYDGLGPHCSAVLKKELYEGTDYLTNPYNYEPVGSGPFKFVEWVRGSHIVLEKYEGYHGGVPSIDRIMFRIIPDPMARALAFEKGEVHWIPFEVPRSEVTRLDALPGNRVFFHGSPCGTILGLGFNMRIEPFTNKAVRKAITAAIDKQKIVDLVYFGGADVGIGHIPLTPFSAWWHNPDAKQIEYNLELAGKILDRAGYPVKEDGWRFHFTLKHTTGYAEHLKVAELIKDDLKKIGVDVTIISLDHAAWHEHVFHRWDFETSLVPFCGGPTPPTMFRYHTENILPVSWANCMGFSNAEYDALFDLMISETDVEKRLKLANRMQEILAEEQPSAFLAHTKNATAIKEGLFTEEPKGVWSLGYLWIHLNRIKPVE
jgi:peptide/nickel transport system substrate-binding protein